jgi:hypothetical protein
MGTHGQTRAEAIALTISALLGLGALAGCTGSGGNSSFSRWGETLPLTAPANTVPASSVTPVSSIT